MASDPKLLGILERARKELLDLTARNRLLNTSRSRSRSSRLEIVGESADDVFQQLVVGRKAMTFQGVPEKESNTLGSDDQTLTLFQPEEEDGTAEVVGTFGDSILQTSLSSEQLQKKLLGLYYDARTFEEEQGVNILYLALGFLKWFEDDNSDVERFAPLLLIPVRLDRQSATAKFRLRFGDDDVSTNLSLQARLKTNFGVTLPEVPDVDELNPGDYFNSVADAVQTKPRWQVLPNDIVLWFFSFSKFLMYRDLQPENWPQDRELEGRGMIQGLLGTGFGSDPPICDDERRIDDIIQPIDFVHVVDADSSQAIVIEEVKRGRNLVIQGPPGTGKSQTITNLISGAVNAGKTVLFVAEKMAALDVVHSRLQRVDLGDMCLELHSSKANKRSVLDNLERTLELGAPRVGNVQRLCEELAVCRDQLNNYLQAIHTPLQLSRLTPYRIVGELVRLRAQGTQPPSFQFANAPYWSQDEFSRRLNALRELTDYMIEVGLGPTHAWRGVTLEAVLPTDVDRLKSKLPSLIARLEALRQDGHDLAAQLGLPDPDTAVSLSSVARLAKRLSMAPTMDRKAIMNSVWSDRRAQINQLIEAGRQFAECRSKLKGVVTDNALETDVRTIRYQIATYGRSWFRFLVSSYHAAQAQLGGLLLDLPPSKVEDRLAILDSLLAYQKADKDLGADATDKLGQAAFGSAWSGCDSDWDKLASILDWDSKCREAKLDHDFRQVYASLEGVPDVRAPLQRLTANFKPILDELNQLFESLKLNLTEAFGIADLNALPFAEVLSRLQVWTETPEALSSWITYYAKAQRLSRDGFLVVVEPLVRGELPAAEAVAQAEAAYYEHSLREVWQNNPNLASFHGASHELVLKKFKELDLARVEMARHQVAQAHFERIPSAASLGGMGIVRREIAKKKGHKPIRKLLKEAGPAIQAIKPVFLMSPISVAQYLAPGVLEFDLLVIDEASQVQPVDALGAAARAKQIVVVGDSKQLPPSRFFNRMLSDDAVDEETVEDVNAGHMESVLKLCIAQGVPSRMLRWHYRSRHHSLIAVSNREFYENRLHVFPSPGKPAKDQGLSFCYVPEGVFDRGGTATNRIEAKAVAESVMEHARHRSDQTLGVGCFSVTQRDAILDELELLRREDPSLEHFFMPSEEPFFIKNLENIQGDERDVILISVGYAKDSSGYMAMTFGPLATEGGERRLNVLITRARDCCRVFSSIRADDIDLDRARSRGVSALKTFLKYAETDLLDTGAATQKDHDSEFERQVAAALERHGFKIKPQVGVAGFFIDLAVVDPKNPGRYLLGIECDGANYHSSRSARDRDRLRTAVLESRGWIIHRIWSTDWFQRTDHELRKTLAAIEAAAGLWRDRDHGPNREFSAAQNTEPTAGLVREERAASCRSNDQPPSQPYVVASFQIHSSSEIHDVSTSELARVVARIVDIEGPIHEEEIVRRVSQLWGGQRAGSRIRAAVSKAILAASNAGSLKAEGPFMTVSNREETLVRDRSDVPVATLRKPEMLPPVEIRQAILGIIQAHIGVSRNEVVAEVARLLGFKLASKPFRELVESLLGDLISAEAVEERLGNLYLPERELRSTVRGTR